MGRYNVYEMVGQKYNRLTVIRQAGTNKNRRVWECLCDCGNFTYVVTAKLRNNHTKSCGCYKLERFRERVTKHRLSQTVEYEAWKNMRQRCLYDSYIQSKDYKDRNITICKRWVNSFENFIKDMGLKPKKKGYELDRIDNDGNYEPENCRFVTSRVNNRNKSNSKWWFIDGVRFSTAEEASRKFKVSCSTIRDWCGDGGNARPKPRKDGCYSELKYPNAS